MWIPIPIKLAKVVIGVQTNHVLAALPAVMAPVLIAKDHNGIVLMVAVFIVAITILPANRLHLFVPTIVPMPVKLCVMVIMLLKPVIMILTVA